MLAGMPDRSTYPSVEWAEVCLWITEHRPDLDARLGPDESPVYLPYGDGGPRERQLWRQERAYVAEMR